MKKSSLLRVMVVMGLIVLLILNLFSIVFAADSDFDDWDNPTISSPVDNNLDTNNVPSGSDLDTNVPSGSDLDTNVPSDNGLNTNISSGNVSTTLNTSNDANENNDVDSLAYTGVEDTNILAIVIVLGVIVAAYSFKKIREYNNV